MKKLTDTELNDLLTLAEAATPGPWHLNEQHEADNEHDYGIRMYGVLNVDENGEVDYVVESSAKGRDQRYIAAANPATLTLLLHELQALRAFKAYVHRRLDEAGIDEHQEQNAINGCRIGSRLTDVLLQHRAAEAAAAPVAGGAWVAVGDRLPEPMSDDHFGIDEDTDEDDARSWRSTDDLLVCYTVHTPMNDPFKAVSMGRFYPDGDRWFLEDGSRVMPTHWQPLPAAPKAATPPAPGIVALPPASHGGNTRNVLNSDTCAAGNPSCLGCSVCAGPTSPCN